MKMIQPIQKKLLFMLLISAVFISCNNKNKASDNDTIKKVADDTKEKVADADHIFDITLVNGSEIIEYSGAVPSDEGGAIYNDRKSLVRDEQGNRDRTIMMFTGKKYNRGAAGVFGLFRVDENWKPVTEIKHGGKNSTNLSIRPKEKGNTYSAISGTLTFSNLKFALRVPKNGAASFTLDFEGNFQKNTSKEDIFQGSGTMILSPERAMGVYKAK